MERGFRIALSMLTLFAAACAGTSTGNPFDGDRDPGGPGIPSEGGGGNCERDPTDLDGLDAPSPLGFSAAEILALTDHGEVSFEWRDTAGAITFGPESGRGTLTIEVTPRDTAPRYVDASPKSTEGRDIVLVDEVGPECPDSVELDVRVHLQSGGGAFNEHFDAVLRATTARVARLNVSRKAQDLEGEFEAQLARPADAQLEGVMFDIAFSEFGTRGSVGLGFRSTSVDTATPLIASWPAGLACEGFGTSLDQAVGSLSAQSGIERFNAAALQLTAPGAAATGLDATFTSSGDSVCVVDLEDPNVDAPSLEFAGTLAIRSEDGRIDGRWATGLRVSEAEVRVAHDLRGSIISTLVEPAVFESTYGIHGIDVSSYDQAGIVFTLSVGPEDAVRGELTVNGATEPNCPPPPPPGSSGSGLSSPGCPGITFVPLWKASINAAPQ